MRCSRGVWALTHEVFATKDVSIRVLLMAAAVVTTTQRVDPACDWVVDR